MQVCKLQEMGPRIHPTDGYVVVSEEVGHLGWDYTQADKHFKSMSNLNSGLLDKSGKGDKKFQFRSVNFPDTLRACLWKWPPGVPPERDCEQNSAGHFCVWVFPHSGFRTMWEKIMICWYIKLALGTLAAVMIYCFSWVQIQRREQLWFVKFA